MHGFEWSLAGNMVMTGMIQEAVEIADATRYRYDRERRMEALATGTPEQSHP
jgi:hypothetical protein